MADMPKPRPAAGEVLIRVEACGVCRTDLKILAGKHASSARVVLPHIPGHEVSGTIAELGPGVSGFEEGDPVVVHIYETCGHCTYCLEGREMLCENLGRWVGFDSPGGMAEYVRCAARRVVKLPPGVAVQDLAILGDAIATGVRAVKTRGAVRAGQTVLLTGVGGVGIHALQAAVTLEASVIVADTSKDRLALALEYGAQHALPAGPDLKEQVKALTDGKGVDAAVDFSGNQSTVTAAAAALKPGGRLVLVGYEANTNVLVPSQDLVLSELEVVGSRYCTIGELRTAAKMVAEGQIRPVIGARLPLAEANEALRLLRTSAVNGRIILTI